MFRSFDFFPVGGLVEVERGASERGMDAARTSAGYAPADRALADVALGLDHRCYCGQPPNDGVLGMCDLHADEMWASYTRWRKETYPCLP